MSISIKRIANGRLANWFYPLCINNLWSKAYKNNKKGDVICTFETNQKQIAMKKIQIKCQTCNVNKQNNYYIV